MTDTFDWRVHATASGGGEFRVDTVRFGDGYTQDSAVGMNGEVQRWSVTVSGFRAAMQEVVDFLRDHKGERFFWTPPMSDEGYYICNGWRASDQGAAYFTVSAEFEQRFMP